MGTPLLLTGDLAVFPTAFGAATVPAPSTAPMAGSSTLTVAGKPVCVAGDEAKVVVVCAYTAGAFTVPGVGKLTIAALASDQPSQALTTPGGKKVLLARSKFTAQLQVTTPAQAPPGATPPADTVPLYTGEGEFQSSNTRVNANE
jgi:hypothetical protein